MRRMVYSLCLALSLFYWFDSVVFDVHDSKFPELRPNRISYRWAVGARTCQLVAFLICVILYV